MGWVSSRAGHSQVSMDEDPYVKVCVQGEETWWECVFLASLAGLGSYGGSLGGMKQMPWD